MGREEEGRAVDFGEGARGVDDGVAELLQDGAVERGEDWVLEDDGGGLDGLGVLVCFFFIGKKGGFKR